MTKRIAAIYILLCILFTGCTPAPPKTETDLTKLDPDLYDQSWFTGDPCIAPCWYGLKPGETSKENAKMVVSGLPFVNSNDLFENYNGLSFSCKIQGDNGGSVIMIFADNGLLEFLYITPNYSITIDQAVEKLGSPDGFSAYPTDPGATGFYLGVIWKEKQLVLEYTRYRADISFWSKSLYEKLDENNGKVPKGLVVQDALIVTPDSIDKMMNYKKWEGFIDN